MQTAPAAVFRSLAFGLEARIVTLNDRSGSCAVSLRGELDALTAPPLLRMLSDIVDAGHACVDLDMHELTFIDAAGLRTLQQVAHAAESRGGRLSSSHTARQVDRLLAIAGLNASRSAVIDEA
jgi:anti-sigma B factor antagonist